MVMADIDEDPEAEWIYGHQLAVPDE